MKVKTIRQYYIFPFYVDFMDYEISEIHSYAK